VLRSIFCLRSLNISTFSISEPPGRASRAHAPNVLADRDQELALDRRKRLANQAFGVLRGDVGRRPVEPPHDSWDRASCGLRQVRESRRARGWKTTNGEPVKVENFRQSVGHLANHLLIEQRASQPLKFRFESLDFGDQSIGALGFLLPGEGARGKADQQIFR
jgi:hypothetical protein